MTHAPTEREKWQAEQEVKKDELALKKRELDIRETESKRAAWTNPLVIAVFSAAIAGVGNVAATVYSAYQQRAADERKATDTEKLESEKAEANLILEMIKTRTQTSRPII
jgi:beta-lactamase regulating signal transducer with metallopeptidase domain